MIIDVIVTRYYGVSNTVVVFTHNDDKRNQTYYEPTKASLKRLERVLWAWCFEPKIKYDNNFIELRYRL